MIRILEVVCSRGCARLEMMPMNYYQNIDRGKVSLIFFKPQSYSGAYDDDIEKNNRRVYHYLELYLKTLYRIF